MGRKSSKKKTGQAYSSQISENIFKIVFLILVVIPLLVRIKVYELISPTIDYSTVYNTGQTGDFFKYNKLILLQVLIIILVCLFVYKIIRDGYRIPFRIEYSILLLLFITVLLSFVFSEYPTIAINGIHDHYEGTTAYLSYFLLFFIAANLSYREQHINYLYYALMIFIGINFVTSMTHFWGYDLFQYYPVKRIITPFGYGVDIVSPQSFIVTTLGNQNYLSGISAAITSIFLLKTFYAKANKEKYLYLVFTVVAFATLLASLSTSGFVTFLALIPIILVFVVLDKGRIKEKVFFGAFIFILFIAIFGIMNSHNPSVWEETFGLFGEDSVVYQKGNTSGNEVIEKKELVMHKEFNLPERGIAPGSGRLFLWQKTMELIKQKPILGYGLDTLYYHFPNNDLAMYANIGTDHGVVTKTHNFYINFAFGAGGVSLILLSILITMVMGKNFMLLLKYRLSNQNLYSISVLFVGLLAILIQWLINDSITGVGVVFWILLGVFSSLYYEHKKIV